MPVGEEIEREIVRQLPSSEIDATARRLGMESLFEDGLAKIQSGETTLAQVLLATHMSEELPPNGPLSDPAATREIVDAIGTAERL